MCTGVSCSEEGKEGGKQGHGQVQGAQTIWEADRRRSGRRGSKWKNQATDAWRQEGHPKQKPGAVAKRTTKRNRD